MPKTWLKNLFVFWLPVALWMGLIYFLSSFHQLQASTIDWQDFVTRKFAHFMEYAILYVLFYRFLKNSTNYPFKKSLLLSLVFTIVYALTDEYHQTLVSGRTGKIRDVLIDSAGGLFGLFFVYKIINYLPKSARGFIKRLSL